MHQKQGERDQQNNVDEATGEAKHEAKNPDHEENDGNGGEHESCGRSRPIQRAYFFAFTACFAAAALLFFCVLELVFACFCAAFLFVAFGDLSPISGHLSQAGW